MTELENNTAFPERRQSALPPYNGILARYCRAGSPAVSLSNRPNPAGFSLTTAHRSSGRAEPRVQAALVHPRPADERRPYRHSTVPTGQASSPAASSPNRSYPSHSSHPKSPP